MLVINNVIRPFDEMQHQKDTNRIILESTGFFFFKSKKVLVL
jgi:hypothetical protein